MFFLNDPQFNLFFRLIQYCLLDWPEVRPSSLFDLWLFTSNFLPNKNTVLIDGPWPLALIPSASIGFSGILYPCGPYFYLMVENTSSILILSPDTIHLLPLASGYSSALTSPIARSLTSIVEYSGDGVGIPGYPPFKISLTNASLEFPCLINAGPKTILGNTLINSVSLCFCASSQKAFSARYLLFG